MNLRGLLLYLLSAVLVATLASCGGPPLSPASDGPWLDQQRAKW